MPLSRLTTHKSRLALILAAGAVISTASLASAQTTTFTEDFDDGAAASDFSVDTVTNPFVDFAADYSALDYSFQAIAGLPPATLNVPSAPNSTGGTTTGLVMRARNTDADAAGYVGATYLPVPLAGDWSVQVDMFMVYNGNNAGGTASTEFAGYGLNNSNSGLIDLGSTTIPPASPSEGVLFANTGEGGAIADYPIYYTDPSDDGEAFPKANAVWAAGGNDVDVDSNGPDNQLHNFYDDPATGIFGTNETPGAPGKEWVVVQIDRVGDEISLSYDGTLISTLTVAESGDGDGFAYLSYFDLYSSTPSAASIEDQFVVFDNLILTVPDNVPEPASLALLSLGGLGLVRRRRA